MKHYQAPWSTTLKIVSWVLTAFTIGLGAFMLWSTPEIPLPMGLLPLTVPCGAALFTIRGYTVTSDAILVHRLFWKTWVPLAGLQSVRFEPDAMRRSLRFGNGGLFSFSGSFHNQRLGDYRAFVTDRHRTVVLRYSGRTLVMSPGAPEQFVREVARASGLG